MPKDQGKHEDCALTSLNVSPGKRRTNSQKKKGDRETSTFSQRVIENSGDEIDDISSTNAKNISF
jgi:hypothetical protein